MEWSEFILCCQYFLRCAGSDWRWSSGPRYDDRAVGQSYLIREDIPISIAKDDDDDDVSCNALMTIHIVYSSSFRAPTFFFNACRSDGRLVVRELLGAADASVMSQGDHPVLGRPFFFIHPCETHAFMKQTLKSSPPVYIVSWLSWIVQPIFPDLHVTLSLSQVASNTLPAVDISLLIPCFNSSAFLEDLIVSVVSQSCLHRGTVIQAVFYDDASRDDTLAQLRKLTLQSRFQHPNLIWTILASEAGQSNLGCGHGRNRCFDSALGSHVCLLDSDDVMHPDRLAAQLEQSLQHPHAIVGCQVQCFPESEKPFFDWLNSLTTTHDLMAYRFREVTVTCPTWFMSRQLFLRVGYFTEKPDFPEDMDFFFRHLRFEDASLIKVAEKLLRYRIHPNQQSYRIHRNALLQIKALFFSEFVVKHWPKGFMFWGCGRDGKKFFKFLSKQAQDLVTCFLEIDEQKRQGLRHGKPVLDVSEVKSPFVCCVTIGKNNGIEEKLKSFISGEDYFQIT